MPRPRRIVHQAPTGTGPAVLEMRRVDSMFYPPRGLSHEEAARYVGISPDTFDGMVRTRQMPKPRMIGKRTVWDRVELDMAFSELPKRGEISADSTAEERLAEALLRTRKKP